MKLYFLPYNYAKRLKILAKTAFCGFAFFAVQLPVSAQTSVLTRQSDSIISLIKNDTHDTTRAVHQIALSRAYCNAGRLPDALQIANAAIADADNSHNNIYIAKTLGNLADVYYTQGNYPAALNYYMQVQSISSQQDYASGLAAAYTGMGNVCKAQGYTPKALSYYLKALNIETLHNHKQGMAICYNNIGIAYHNIQAYTQALGYYFKALQIDRQLNNPNGMAADLNNMGDAYNALGDTAQALNNYKQSLALYAAAQNASGIAVLTGNIGELCLKQKKTAEAEKYLTASVVKANQAGNLQQARHGYQVLGSLYAAAGKWQQAYTCLTQYGFISDSLYNKARIDQTGRLQAKYEYDKELTARQAESNKAAAVAQAEHKKQVVISVLIGVLALMALVIALFVFRLLKAARREKLAAEQQKALMELKALRAQMNPHFIFNALNSIQHFILKNNSEEAQKHLNRFSKLIRMVLENSRLESITLTEEIKMLQLYAELEAVRFSSQFIYTFTVGEGLNPDAVTLPPLLIQPFVENAIWHGLMHLTEKQGVLSVSFTRENNTLVCTIDDNGVGRQRSQQMHRQAAHTPAGLSITRERINLLNEIYGANISLNITDRIETDGTPAGTIVRLTLPLGLNKKA